MDIEPDAMHIARAVQRACIDTARRAFADAAQSGLCGEGSLEAAIGAMQTLDLAAVVRDRPRARP